jgi:hypothetical protein
MRSDGIDHYIGANKASSRLLKSIDATQPWAKVAVAEVSICC